MAIYLTPGPSQPHPRLREFMEDAWRDDVMAISHRGRKFTDIYRRTDTALRALMDVPADWQLMFTGSATEAMERLVQGVVRERSHHFVNGAFSKKWYEIAGQLGKTTSAQQVEAGAGFAGFALDVPPDAELVCVTLSETSTGVLWPAGELERLTGAIADLPASERPLVAVDVVSAAPVVPVAWDTVDAAFFSVQKAFGLPAGLGVLMLGPRALARAEELAADGTAQGSYHRISELAVGAAKYQTPATPNVLAIYLLGRVAESMCEVGSAVLRAENAARGAAFYSAVAANPHLEPFVTAAEWRSPMIIVADVKGGSGGLHDHFVNRGYVPGQGYGKFKDQHIRLANFPATSEREFEEALAHLVQFDGPASAR